MIEDDCADNVIPLPNVTDKILAKVIEYCKRHVDASAASSDKAKDKPSSDEDVKGFDSDFVKVDQAILFDLILVGEAQHVNDERLCKLCEEFADQALNYLSENKTQTEIIDTLHKSCSKIPSFKQQCIVLVDYYAPLFFLEVSSIETDQFCRKVDLCEERVSISHRLSQDKCGVCHDVVSEALLKLKDPDTELEIVQLLLKTCNSIGKNVKKCKRLVFEYAPVILVNAEQFLETKGEEKRRLRWLGAVSCVKQLTSVKVDCKCFLVVTRNLVLIAG
ncbi:hypothetical protein CASFOL_028062 [Castilleja foliolosa]|uniref:Pulmonary surfactant-associated protein B n=1 Tax=Castilleja foliolosa TaxID=1961234 RepID=A0ABD3CDI0_9LAMI